MNQSEQALQLLRNLQDRLPEMATLLEIANTRGETGFYKFYSGSFKVMHLRHETMMIVELLGKLMPERELHEDFLQIVKEGTGENVEGRRILEAFFHARMMLENGLKCAQPGAEMVSFKLLNVWRAVLDLYGIYW